MNNPATSSSRWWQVAAVTVVLAALVWLWVSFCLFPTSPWNDARLEPSFLLAHGLPMYPARGMGAVTTWIYGPLPAFVLLPATLARSAAQAILIADLINLLTTAGAIGFVCATWPGQRIRPVDRWISWAACIAIWPGSSFHFIQADNYAVACGLLASAVLVRNLGRPSSAQSWGAALFGAAALMCKQTSVAPLLAQGIWFWWSFGFKAAWNQAVRGTACLAALGVIALSVFEPSGLWYNVIKIPSLLPFTQEAGRRMIDLIPFFLVHLGLPAIGLAFFHRRAREKGSALALAAIAFFISLPLGMAGLMTVGGSINSLQGLPYLLPALAITFFVSAPLRLKLAAGALLLGIFGWRAKTIPFAPFTPELAEIREGAAIARDHPGQVWIPWHPVIVFYSDGRFDHAEDGLYVRLLTGQALDRAQLRAFLPPRWHMTAVGPPGSSWGVATSLTPAGSASYTFGHWTLHDWNLPSSVSPAKASPNSP